MFSPKLFAFILAFRALTTLLQQSPYNICISGQGEEMPRLWSARSWMSAIALISSTIFNPGLMAAHDLLPEISTK
jgi:hypothetical protein